MRGSNTACEPRGPAVDSTDYVRFVILSGARTGSHMLAQALNTSPKITCFREVFNFLQAFVQFEVGGYDNFSARDLSLRTRDPIRFLEERIFCRQPKEVRAVGFKLHYGQLIGFEGLPERLTEDSEIRVLHLRRRNLLRMLVSLKLAETTGVFLEDTRRKNTLADLLKATRYPLKAASRLQRRLQTAKAAGKAPRPRVTISTEELFNFMVRTRIRAANHEDLFREHPRHTVFYEDLVDRREEVFREVQSFLGIEPGPLTVTLRRQNPEPLRELIENYDELYEAYKKTPEAALFA
jgi:hypothetical protein